ncbi:precorrin-6A/cobalt-precorrin-6A reductase [Devosia sp. A8/3-2]|nr:precorrin-6A/cobalt-precorrin-6A reductase [Devosia sp. A8/3-2]
MKILIPGGTAEAQELADRLVAMGHDVITSLAGRTQDPKLPKGDIRMGKFGGIPGLCAYLRAGDRAAGGCDPSLCGADVDQCGFRCANDRHPAGTLYAAGTGAEAGRRLADRGNGGRGGGGPAP